MNLEELRAVQADERESDSLQPLPDSFYREATEYLAELREERRRAADRAADPFSSDEVRRLTDEIETAQEVLEAIYERRVGKVVARASLAAADMSADQDALTDEEAALFTDLVERIEANREAVLDAIAGEGSIEAATDVTSAPDGPTDEPSGSAGDPGSGSALGAEAAMGTEPAEEAEDFARGEAPTDDTPTSGSVEPDGGAAVDPGEEPATDQPPETAAGPEPNADDPDRMTVRITEDVGEVFGVDERVYDLAAEDVVTLPAPNAEPLIERNAAQPLD